MILIDWLTDGLIDRSEITITLYFSRTRTTKLFILNRKTWKIKPTLLYYRQLMTKSGALTYRPTVMECNWTTEKLVYVGGSLSLQLCRCWCSVRNVGNKGQSPPPTRRCTVHSAYSTAVSKVVTPFFVIPLIVFAMHVRRQMTSASNISQDATRTPAAVAVTVHVLSQLRWPGRTARHYCTDKYPGVCCMWIALCIKRSSLVRDVRRSICP